VGLFSAVFSRQTLIKNENMNLLQKLFESIKPALNKPVGRRMLNFERTIDERIAILEMLLWKYHTQEIPNDVFNRLVENGFMEKTRKGTFHWTDLSNEIGEEFNSKFNYA